MISVHTSYTVKAEFVQKNKENIALFLSDFKNLPQCNFLYNVFIKEDSLTFVHIAMYESEQDQNTVLNVPSFLQFQKERDESGLNETPKIEFIELVGSSLSLL
jgi:hypothetical protein